MRRKALIVFLTAAAAVLLSSPARANSFVNYTITSSYNDPATQASAVSSNGQSFTLNFTLNVPINLLNSDPTSFTTTTPVTFTSGATTMADSAAVQLFFTGGLGGGLNIQFNLPSSQVVTWSFSSSQLFSGSTSNPSMILGLFGVNSGSTFTLGSNPSSALGTSGSILASTPEPGSLILVGSGLVGLAGCLRKRFFRS